MNQAVEKFKELNDTDKISSINTGVAVLTFVLTIASIAISYLGYSINSAAEKRNASDWKIAQAKHIKDFWNDIELAENSVQENLGIMGDHSGKFIVAAVKTLDEIGLIYSRGGKPTITPNNLKLNAEFTALISSYTALQASLDKINSKYNNSVLVQSSMASALNIKGWDDYLEQSVKFKEWKVETIKPYDKLFQLIQKTTKSGNVPADFPELIQDYSFKLGYSLKNIAPPSLNGFHALKVQNWPNSKHNK